ncbi:MAG: pyridoxamine 5'-phosphate oxidase [Bdellovibrionales bacterium]
MSQSIFSNDPFEQLSTWLEEAEKADLSISNAMTIATIGLDGYPKCRTVLLKEFDGKRIKFFTNYNSDKGKELEENPNISAMFYWWPPLDYQLRIEGRVVKLSSEESDSYYNSRPEGSRIGAWASDQSKIMKNPDELKSRLEKTIQGFDHTEITRPDYWGGYEIIPHKMEFMILRTSRLHDRLRFTLDSDNQWQQNWIYP